MLLLTMDSPGRLITTQLHSAVYCSDLNMLLSFRTVVRERMRHRIEFGTSEKRLQTLGVFWGGDRNMESMIRCVD